MGAIRKYIISGFPGIFPESKPETISQPGYMDLAQRKQHSEKINQQKMSHQNLKKQKLGA